MTFVVTPFLSSLLVLIKVPDVEEWLKAKNLYSGLYIGIGIALATVIIHIINVISPFKKYEKIEKNKWVMIDLVINSFNDNFFKKNRLAVNVMICKRCFFNQRMPHKKDNTKPAYHFFQKIFKVIWSFDGNPIDKRLVFTTKQGVSGLAFAYGKPVLIDVKNDGDSELNLSEAQKKAIANLEFIISCPIFALDEQYGKLSTKIIGILNVSCSHSHSRVLIEKPEDRSNLTTKVMDFSKICSLIM